MDSGPIGVSIIGLVISYFLSSFFSVAKIVFHSINKNSLPADNENLRFYASKIENIIENKSLLSTTVSLGKNVSNISFSIFSFILLMSYYPQKSILYVAVLSFVISVFVLSLFSHTIMSAIAHRFPINLMPIVYILYSFLNALFFFFASTLVFVHDGILHLIGYDEKFSFLSKEEKSRLSEDSEDEQALDEDEKDMIHSIFEFGETTVKEIMVPRIDVEGLDINTDFDTVIKKIKTMGHSRIPIYEGNVDSITGILYAKDILGWIADKPNDKWNLSKIMKQPHFVPESKKIDDLLSEFKTRQIHMAIVVDEYGGTAGIVTLEDILEEIVGEIRDEFDEDDSPVLEIGKNLYKVDPHFDLDDLKERLNLDINLDDVDYNTLGGLIYHEVGDVPQEGTELEHGGIRIKVIKMDNQRIEEVQLEVLKQQNESLDVENSF